MIKTLTTALIILWALSFSSFADSAEDLKDLTAQCIIAAKQYRPVNHNYPYKVLHTVQYKGWSGDTDHAELKRPVLMTITFAGNQKSGSWWFIDNPPKKYMITAKSDDAGSLELVEVNNGGASGHIFHGIMKDGIVKGLWQKRNGQGAFAFYVVAKELWGRP